MTDRTSSRRSSSKRAVAADAFRRAVAAFDRGAFTKAASRCEATLSTDPENFDALHLLGVVNCKLRRLDEALIAYDHALQLRPDASDVCNNRGSALADLGRFDEALASYDKALAGNPAFAAAHNNRGCVLMFMERFDDALAAHGKALVLDPNNAEYINNLGRALTRLLRYDDALDCFDDAVVQRPGFIDALLNRGKVFEELDCHDDAVAAYGEAMDAGADMGETLLRRAGALTRGKRYREALLDYDRALRLFPNIREAWLGRGTVLAHLQRGDEAIACVDEALRLGLDRVSVLFARRAIESTLEREEDMLATARQLVALAPDDADAQNALGLSLMHLDHFDEAMTCYKTALSLRANLPVAEWNLGYLLLLHGRFREGFGHYEARRRQLGTRWTRLEGPEWRGEPLEGKRLLVYAEQAFGDALHFARYTQSFATLGAKVIFGVHKPLAALMSSAKGVSEVVCAGERPPSFDFHLPLMSAPLVLGHDETDIPGDPYLFAKPSRVALWKERLPQAALKVGIAWQGSLSIPGRSVPLAAFAPLTAVPGVKLICLQKGDGLEQLELMPSGLHVETLRDELDSGADAFLDTAAVMMSLDLIISIDTSIAHLAGAMGRPVWIVLKAVPDWRWMLERRDSPWYPTARLYRRAKEDEDWSPVMIAIATDLEKLASSATAFDVA